jgi:hypothetical protein
MQREKRSRVEEAPLFWNFCKYIHRLQLLPSSSEQFYLPASYKTISRLKSTELNVIRVLCMNTKLDLLFSRNNNDSGYLEQRLGTVEI